MTEQNTIDATIPQDALPLSDARFSSLTSQVFGAYRQLDAALAHTLRMTSDMIETAGEIGLAPEAGQLLFDDLTSCVGTMIVSRKQLVKAHRRAHVIRQRTTKAKEGCTRPWGVIEKDNVVTLSAVG